MKPKEPTSSIEFEYIDTAAQLDRLTDEMQSVDEVALDTEADSFHHYRPVICLIQLSFNGHNYIVDPLADMDMSRFLDVLSNTKLIIHDAGYDLRLLYQDFQFKPNQPVYDTMLAATLAGLKSVSLSAMLSMLFDKDVAKHNQRADWSKRPLQAKLLHYAVEDTAFLMPIKQHLQQLLEQMDRTDWHTEACEWAVRAAFVDKEPTDPDRQWRIKGSGQLGAREMAFVQAIWHWRQGIAERTNLALFMICPGADIIRLAEWAAKRKKPIENSTKLPIPCKRNRNSLMETLQATQQLSPQEWPEKIKSDRSKRLSDATRKVIDELKTECEKVANELDLPVQLLASRSALTRIVLGNTTTAEEIRQKEILMNWQIDLLLNAIQKVLV